MDGRGGAGGHGFNLHASRRVSGLEGFGCSRRVLFGEVVQPVEQLRHLLGRAQPRTRVPGFGSQVLGFGSLVLDFGSQISGFGFRVLDFGFRILADRWKC